ncbi:hypothetical protein Vretimale_4198, partial [Volvox reticuliferus]
PARRMARRRQAAQDRLPVMAAPGPVMHLMLPAHVGARLLSSGGVNGDESGGAGLLSYVLAPAVMAIALAVAAADVWAWRIRRLVAQMLYIFAGSTISLLLLPLHVRTAHVSISDVGAAVPMATESDPSSYPPTSSIATQAVEPAATSATAASEPVGAFRLIPPIPVAY